MAQARTDSRLPLATQRRDVDGGQRQADVPKYAVHATRQNGLFNAGVTTRANVGRFIADLVSEEAVWARWKGSFPQIFDVRKEMK